MLEVIGREEEFAALEAFFDLALLGACALVIRGVPGIGKTTLWREGVAAARRRSLRVLSCRPTPSETQLPYAGLGDLLAPTGEAFLEALPGPQRAALEVALLRATPEGPPLEQRAVATAVLGVLRDLARAGPLLVAVDDVQWLDAPSARTLGFALRRIGLAPVSILLSVRGEAGDEIPLGLERALGSDRIETREVEGLPLNELGLVLHRRLGTAFRRPILLQLHRVSGGNPLFALELGQALLRRKTPLGPGEPLPVPGTLRELMTERLAGLSDAGRQTLLAASMLARPTLALLRTSTNRAGVDEALAEGVIEAEEGAVHFTHPLLASTVYSEAPPEARRRLHRRLAEMVVDPEERPRHLALGAEGPDPEVALALDEAVWLARARGAPEAAAGLAEQAARLTPPEQTSDVRRRTLEAAEHHFRAGDLPRAGALLEQILPEAPPGTDRARVLARLGEVRAPREGFRPMGHLFEQALLDAGDDDRLRAELEHLLGYVCLQSADAPGAAMHARAALRLAEDLDDAGLLLESVAALAFFEFLLGHGVRTDLLERAAALEVRCRRERSEPRPGQSHLRAMHALVLKWSGDLDGGRDLLEASYRRMLESGDESALPFVCCQLSELECWAGEWELAARYADQGCQIVLQTGQESLRGVALHARALVEAHRGQLEAARATVEEGLAAADQTDNIPVAMQLRAVLGFVELSAGNPPGVHQHLGPLVEGTAAMGIGEPSVVRFVPDEIEALVALGELERAEGLIDRLDERGRALDRPWALATAARCRGLLHGTRGDWEGAFSAFEEAREAHPRLSQPFELGRTLLVRGVVHRRARQKHAARESLEESEDIFESLGAPLWAEQARAELARIGGRAPAPNGLSPTEARVAELVAAGHTNREVADLLFRSVKTVEGDLSRIYRKLGVSSRRELARQVASR